MATTTTTPAAPAATTTPAASTTNTASTTKTKQKIYTLSPQWQSYLQQLQTQLTNSAPTISYNPKTADQLKTQLASALRPGYDNAIRQRQNAVAANNASIDTDAAARGMGASSWVTDVKNRQRQSAAGDVANLEGSYSAALSQQLMSKLSEQEGRQLSVDQFNATQKSTALQQALAALESQYATFKREDPTGKSGGGGGDVGGNYRPMEQYRGTIHNDWWRAANGIPAPSASDNDNPLLAGLR